MTHDSARQDNRPRIVCLCGSTRFGAAFREADFKETLAGRIVLTIGCNTHSDADLFDCLPDAEMDDLGNRLDELHLRKIDLADEILVINVSDYVGESTAREIEYAHATGKRIRWLEPHIAP